MGIAYYLPLFDETGRHSDSGREFLNRSKASQKLPELPVQSAKYLLHTNLEIASRLAWAAAWGVDKSSRCLISREICTTQNYSKRTL